MFYQMFYQISSNVSPNVIKYKSQNHTHVLSQGAACQGDWLEHASDTGSPRIILSISDIII